jgi:hypothetical protein
MATFTYPTSAELRAIEQDKMPRLLETRPVFDIFPIVNSDQHHLRWEQYDNFTGLQQARGLNGEPSRVTRVGAKIYQVEPGIYGEFLRIDEVELTLRRQMGTWNRPISIDDLVVQAQDQLLLRRLDRIEKIVWDLVTTGTFSVPGPNGTTIYTDTYTLQTYSAGVSWGTVATATPLQDFRAVQLKSRGRSVNFGAHLGGKRVAGLQSILGRADINRVLTMEDLPTIEIYDEGYIDDSNNFQLYIPNSKVVVVGQRPAGQLIGEYRFTRNANNPNMAAGPYTKVFDTGEVKVPRSLEVHDGHNGGPVCFYPSAIVVMTVS